MSDRSEHELLMRHFAAWAEAKNRDVDLDFVGRLLDLRFAYDEEPATYWPAGSIEDLLLRLWPAKGEVTPPHADTVATSLDAYMRFLRSTGRMAAKSASPNDLRKEARRSAPRMAEVAADRSTWSAGKTLSEYGREIGVDLDNAPDVESLQAKLDEINDSWNALPIHERRRRMPSPSDDPELTGAEQAMDAYGIDDPIEALILGFRYELPDGTLPPVKGTAPLVRDSAYTQSLVALCHWVGDGAEVTSTDVLRPAAAHRAYDELGLVEWTKAKWRRSGEVHPPPLAERIGLDAWVDERAADPWRNAADCEALDRLWRGALASGAIEIEGRKARSTIDDVTDDEQWLSIGVLAIVQLLEDLSDRELAMSGLAYALLRSYSRRCALVPWDEIVEFVDFWNESAAERERIAANGWDSGPFLRAMADMGIAGVADTGILEESDVGVRLTPLGDVVVSAWLGMFSGE
ncbi:MAG TPA: hypothetical protein VFR22_14225 [Nocardioidaceae bacterium]|nr:hypothetical protein [Nocardioidaceae bacterium]